jgi:lysophospholipase L1-like esterase
MEVTAMDETLGRLMALGLWCLAMMPAALDAAGAATADRWEKAIQAIEERDRKQQPPKGQILLCGSSSARGWNVRTYFPDHQVVNRGFGGSQIHDSTRHADRIILPLEPRVILLYAGDNDIASGKAPETVCENFKLFVQKIHASLPRCRIVFIAIKPSIARWKLVGKMREANRLIQAVTEADERLAYVDIDTPMIGEDGKPRPELFVKDGLHLSPKGYELWTKLVLPHLAAD